MTVSDKITVEDVLDALASADVLDTFCQLLPGDQEDFARWIGKARDDESHWRRINALVMALRIGPLQPSSPWEQAAHHQQLSG